MHAVRRRFLDAFEHRLSLLRRAHATAAKYAALGRADAPDADVLLPDLAGMEQLKARVFDHWQTAEDLEDLAARDYLLTTADLDRVGPQRRPPASYYAEEGRPF
jgi:hypothetical protein